MFDATERLAPLHWDLMHQVGQDQLAPVALVHVNVKHHNEVRIDLPSVQANILAII